eukprot:9051624-Pyramimonas_sp.AAC.1
MLECAQSWGSGLGAVVTPRIGGGEERNPGASRQCGPRECWRRRRVEGRGVPPVRSPRMEECEE